MQVDPAVATTGQPYAYAGNNPLQNVDPLGLDWWSDALNNVAAFGAGALNELTGGLSGAILSATVPGYDCFVKDHRDWYDAGTVVAVVTEIVVAVATVVVSAGTATAAVIGVAVVKAALRQSAKGAAKAIEHGVENTVAHTAERSLAKEAAKEARVGGRGSAAPGTFERTEALAGRASSRRVNEYSQVMRERGWQGAPIKVVAIDGLRIVVDGHHRLAAAQRAGIDVLYEIVDPATVIRPGVWTSVDDILKDMATVGPNRLR
jgi:hypothetical protein